LFSLNEAATVTFTFSLHTTGHRSHDRCVLTGRSQEHRCTVTVISGTLTFGAHQGLNSVAFQGVLPHVKLRPGHYTLAVTATNSAGASAPQTLDFTIVE
jgi:hypothetical protein